MEGAHLCLPTFIKADNRFSAPKLPLEVHVAAHLLEISRSHAVHRFVIEDERSVPRLFVSIL